MVRDFTEGVLKTYLVTLSHGYLNEYAACKQKSYMKSGFIKSLEVPAYLMASRLMVMHTYLVHYPSHESTSFLQGT